MRRTSCPIRSTRFATLFRIGGRTLLLLAVGAGASSAGEAPRVLAAGSGPGETGIAPRSSAAPAARVGAVCRPDAETLCLAGGRFAVRVSWDDFSGGSGTGKAIPGTDLSGSFWFFDSDNVELVVKVLDGRVLNDHFWFFYGSLTNVHFQITVDDESASVRRTYENPSGHFGSLGDIVAFRDLPARCGGLAGLRCDPGEVCDQDPGFCGGADILGTCVPQPSACPSPSPSEAVCGCDAKTYGSDCLRLLAHGIKDHDGPCPSL